MVIEENEIKKAVDTLIKGCVKDNNSYGLEISRDFQIGDDKKKFNVKFLIEELTYVNGEWVNLESKENVLTDDDNEADNKND